MRKIMLFFVLMPVLSFAQIQVGGTPFALKKRINLFEINKFVLSDYDKKILLLEDERQKQIKPYAFAKGYDVVVKFNAKPDLFNGILKKYNCKSQSLVERVMKTVNARINVGKWSNKGALNILRIRLAHYYNDFDVTFKSLNKKSLNIKIGG